MDYSWDYPCFGENVEGAETAQILRRDRNGWQWLNGWGILYYLNYNDELYRYGRFIGYAKYVGEKLIIYRQMEDKRKDLL